MMAGCFLTVLKIGFEFDLGVLFADIGVLYDFQTPPMGRLTPCQHTGLIEQVLLGRDSRFNDIGDIVQNIGAVSGTHQLFGGLRQAFVAVEWGATVVVGLS